MALDTADIAAEAALMEAARRRGRREAAIGERRSGRLLAGSTFIVVMAGWLLLATPRSVPIGTLASCVAVYVVASCVEFEIGPGCATPATPVQVVMLFLLPAQLVPVAVFSGLLLMSLVARLWDPARKERTMALAASSWQVVGPAVVFAVAHNTRPLVSDWPLYVLALAVQFGLDAATCSIVSGYGLGVPMKQLAAALRFTFLCDASLAPVGFAAAFAFPGSRGALIILLPPIVLLAILQLDRRRQIDKVLALSTACRDSSELARRDALTGVLNRLAWEEATARFEGLATSVGVILADVDGLKTANDSYGHAMGDQLIVAVAALIADVVADRPDAPVYRIGGDEFAVLVPFASIDETRTIAASLRAALRIAPPIESRVSVSASVGVGVAAAGLQLGRAIATADREVNHEKTSRGVRRS